MKFTDRITELDEAIKTRQPIVMVLLLLSNFPNPLREEDAAALGARIAILAKNLAWKPEILW